MKEQVKMKDQALDKLISENERFAATLSTIGGGIITTNAQGKILFINSAAEKITGWCKSEAIGKAIIEVLFIINEDTTPIKNHLIEEVSKKRDSLEFIDNSILLSKDGREKFIVYSSAPIMEEYGDIVGFIFVFRDITAHKAMEKELLKTKRIGSLGSSPENIAHDFNNILSAILSNVSITKMQINSKEDIYYNMKEIEDIIFYAKRLTQSLLPLLEDTIPDKKIISVSTLLKDSCSFNLKSSNITYECHFPNDLWPVEVDENQIFQAFNNLIVNSKQSMLEGGTLKINIENVSLNKKDIIYLEEGKYIKVSIKDQGTGIARDHLHKIFDFYFTTKREGSGLGLAITHSIVKKHGGYITVESELNKGTTFIIYLPAVE